jgi:hypothetical protein
VTPQILEILGRDGGKRGRKEERREGRKHHNLQKSFVTLKGLGILPNKQAINSAILRAL